MKAVIQKKYGGPEVLEVQEVAIPVPTDTQVLIRIHASTVTATDPIMRSGRPFIVRLFGGFLGPKNPIPGDGLSGIVEAVGKDVTLFKPGDEVFGATGLVTGAHAEYMCVPESGALAMKPSKITHEDAASLVDGGLTALPFLRDTAGIQRGNRILINGASGGVGTIAVQLAKHFGAEVTAVCSGGNADLVRSLGADATIDYNKEDFAAARDQYDIIFDIVGKRSFDTCKRALRNGGVYMTAVPTIPGMIRSLFTGRRGGKNSTFAATGLRAARERAEDLVRIGELASDGVLRVIIDKRYSLDDIADAHRYVASGHKRGNVVLSLQDAG